MLEIEAAYCSKFVVVCLVSSFIFDETACFAIHMVLIAQRKLQGRNIQIINGLHDNCIASFD